MPTSRLAHPRQLGRTGPSVFPLALGCMAMSGSYGPADDAESIRAIHAAIEGGITLLDTGDFYGMGHNELLLARALRELSPSTRDRVILSVKFGAQRTPSGSWSGFDGRPAGVKNYLAYSLTRLGVSSVAIYRPARLGDIPIEDTMGAVADMIKQGYVQHAALSEVSAETARRAQAVTPITDVQLEYSLATRGAESRLVPGLRELGIGVTAYGVFGRGLLTGSVPTEKSDARRYIPRFAGEAATANRALIQALHTLAVRHAVSPAQLLVAWALSQGSDIIPVIGSRTVAQVQDSLRALALNLSQEELAELEAALPHDKIQGTRYDRIAMSHLDSER